MNNIRVQVERFDALYYGAVEEYRSFVLVDKGLTRFRNGIYTLPSVETFALHEVDINGGLGLLGAEKGERHLFPGYGCCEPCVTRNLFDPEFRTIDRRIERCEYRYAASYLLQLVRQCSHHIRQSPYLGVWHYLGRHEDDMRTILFHFHDRCSFRILDRPLC